MPDFLQKVVPWIGAAATGNVPALIALAAKQVGDIIGVPVPADGGAIANAVANATPEQVVALRQADNDFQAKMQAMGFAHAEEVLHIGYQTEALYVDDTADARKVFGNNGGVLIIACATLLIFTAVMIAVLLGCYKVLTGDVAFKSLDPGSVACVFGLLGAVVRDVSNAGMQVWSYFFGSSQGSADNRQAMGAALDRATENLGKTAASPK